MFTVRFENANGDWTDQTANTIDEAQQIARKFMGSWYKTNVVYTQAPGLVIFSATCGVVTKEYK